MVFKSGQIQDRQPDPVPNVPASHRRHATDVGAPASQPTAKNRKLQTKTTSADLSPKLCPPEPVEYVPGWQRLQDPGSGAPATSGNTAKKIPMIFVSTLSVHPHAQCAVFNVNTLSTFTLWQCSSLTGTQTN